MKAKELFLKFKKPFIIVKIFAFILLDVQLTIAPPLLFADSPIKSSIAKSNSFNNNKGKHHMLKTDKVYKISSFEPSK